MEWLVGMDLSDRGQGALAYTAWLKRSLRAGESDDRFSGVHVFDETVLVPMLRHHTLEELEQKAEGLADEAIGRVGEGFEFDERRLVHGRSAEESLGELAGGSTVRGLIIGRQAKRGEQRFVRLGKVARRLLRSLPAPVIVVPPDLRQPSIGSGPVLLAASTDADGTAAAEFAQSVADDLGRPLEVAHVIPIANYLYGDPMAPGLTGAWLGEVREKYEHRLGVWMQMHNLSDVPKHIVDGSIAEGLARIAIDRESPLVVCGSRGLGLGLRLFTSSVASDLAASSEVAVAVVPSPPES